MSDILSKIEFLLTKPCSKWHKLSHICQGFLGTEKVLDVEKDVPKNDLEGRWWLAVFNNRTHGFDIRDSHLKGENSTSEKEKKYLVGY